MHDWQGWMVAALLLFVAEMFAPGFWLLCVGLGSLAAGIVGLAVPSFVAQGITFAGTTLLSLAAVRPYLVRHFHAGSHAVRTNVDALIGKTGFVSERIDPDTGKGRVIVDGEDWRGASLLEEPLEPGTKVSVVRVDGTVLFVDKEP